MSFRKNDVCPFCEGCEVIENQKRVNSQVIEELAEIDYILRMIGYSADYLARPIEKLLAEAKERLYKCLKALDPQFPGDDDPYFNGGFEYCEDEDYELEYVKKDYYAMIRDRVVEIFRKLKGKPVLRAVFV